MPPRVLCTMVTTTSYGTWLPGDLRGYVQDGRVLPGDPALLSYAKSMMSKDPVYFTAVQQDVLFDAIRAAADEFDYALTDFSIEPWHTHWLIGHGFDPVATMVGRLKTRMRQALDVGRIWTEGFCARCIEHERAVVDAQRYIARHNGCRMTDGVVARRARRAAGRSQLPPGVAGG